MTAVLSNALGKEIMAEAYAKYDKCFADLVKMYTKVILNAEYCSIEDAKIKAEKIALRLLGPKEDYK